MLKSVIVFGGAIIFAVGCSSLTAYRNASQPPPPNWDIAQDQPQTNPPVVSVLTAPAMPALVRLPATKVVLTTNLETSPPAAVTNSGPEPAAAPASSSELESEETWVGLNHWAQAHGLDPAERVLLPPLEITTSNGYPWRNFSLKARTSVVPLPTFLLHTTNGAVVIQPETRAFHWDDVEILLGFTPELVQGEVLVHAEDLRHTLEPLLHGPPALPVANRTIVIDPDDEDNGQNIPRYLLGKNFALDWAKRLAALLATNGWTVFLTHTDALFVPLSRRAAFADLHQPNLFVSLCFGIKCLDADQSGLATYCLVPASMPSAESPASFEESWHPFPNNVFDTENLEYAFSLHHFLNDVPDIEDRGVRRTRFIDILQDRNCPAICVSGGSLSDPHDAALIATPVYRQKLAEAIASALQ